VKGMQRFYTILGWIAVLYMAVLFLYPVCKVAATSVWVDGSFTWVNYKTFFAESVYTEVLLKTLWVSALSAIIALIIGYGLAYFIVRRPAQQQGFWMMIVIASMFMSLTIRLFGWMIVLGEEGPILKALQAIFGDTFTIQLLFSPIAVIVGIVHFVLPFVVLNMMTALKKIDPSLAEASIMLGASPLRTFWLVIFPLSTPGVYAAASLSFSLGASTFLVSSVLGGPKDSLMSNIAYNAIINVGNMGLGAAISCILLVIVVMVLMGMSAMERRGNHVR
jgi:ABC-type spermidine/putrescine transport system permease subunit I